jgi:hypothetical protein
VRSAVSHISKQVAILCGCLEVITVFSFYFVLIGCLVSWLVSWLVGWLVAVVVAVSVSKVVAVAVAVGGERNRGRDPWCACGGVIGAATWFFFDAHGVN